MVEILEKISEYDSDPTQFYTEIEIDGQTILVPFIRQSERKAFKTCQYQWDWSWNQGFVPALPKQDARWFGTGLHLCLAEWYIKGSKRGRDMHKTWDEFTGDNYQKIATGPYFNPDEWVDAKALGNLTCRAAYIIRLGRISALGLAGGAAHPRLAAGGLGLAAALGLRLGGLRRGLLLADFVNQG